MVTATFRSVAKLARSLASLARSPASLVRSLASLARSLASLAPAFLASLALRLALGGFCFYRSVIGELTAASYSPRLKKPECSIILSVVLRFFHNCGFR